MLKGTKAYVQTKFTTAGQGDVLILLYDGALKFLTQAKEKMLANDVAAKGKLISKALDIINELDCSLNIEAGGELAQNLHQLYLICSTRLLQANLRMDPTILDSVSEILSGLRSAYAQIINTPEAQAISTQIASKMSAANNQPQRAVPLPSNNTATSGIGRAQAQNAYGQQQLTKASSSQEQPIAQPIPSTAQSVAQSITQPVAAMPTSTQPDITQENIVQPQPTEAMPATPEFIAPPVNLAARRLAATARYGQVAQVSGA